MLRPENASLGITINSDRVITAVEPGSDAASSGVLIGDVVLQLDRRDAGEMLPLRAVERPLHVKLQRHMSEAMPGVEISVDPVSSEMPVSVEMRAASAVLDNVRLDEGTERFANRRGSLQSEAL